MFGEMICELICILFDKPEIGFWITGMLTAIFVILEINGYIAWPWWLILSPIVLFFLFYVIMVVATIIAIFNIRVY